MHQWLAPDQVNRVIHSWESVFDLLGKQAGRCFFWHMRWCSGRGVKSRAPKWQCKSVPFSTELPCSNGEVSSSSQQSGTKECQRCLNRTDSACSLKERRSVCNPQMGFKSGVAEWALCCPPCKPAGQIAFYSAYDPGTSLRVKLNLKRRVCLVCQGGHA